MGTINLIVNGAAHEHSDDPTVNALLQALGADPQHVAVLCNDAVVKRPAYPTTTLTEGDRIEIMTMIGGG